MKKNIFREKSKPDTFLIKGLLCLILMGSYMVNAQNIGRIEGRLLNPAKKPVMLATAALFSLPDSLLVEGVITDTTGYFKYTNLPFGSYVIKFRNIGYKNTTMGSIELSSATSAVDLHSVIMEEDLIDISEVEIVGERMKGTAKVDKIVYPISEKVAAVSHTGLELLRLVPAVQVDFSKNVSLEGSKNILIYVDDRLRDKNFLAQLDAKTIDKIEVMTNPSVKYGADVSGVIHIKLKKERKGGFSGGLGGEQSLNWNALYTDFRLNLEYGTSKFRIYASGLGDYQKFMARYYDNRRTIDGSYQYLLTSEGKDTYGGSDINYGVDWFINDKNTVNFYGYSSPKSGLSSEVEETKEWLSEGVSSKYLTNSPGRRLGFEKSDYYGVFYRRTFAKSDQAFIFDANYLFNTNIVENAYNEQYYLPDKLTPLGILQQRTENSTSQREAFYAKADYSHPISEKLMLYLGYQNNIQWNRSSSAHASDAIATSFEYSELRHGAYVNLSGQTEKFSWQGGLRLESSNTQIDEKVKNNYVCLLPQLSLQHRIGEQQSIQLSYRRSIQRPGIAQLNPFVFSSDSLSLVSGNPNLKPAYHNKLELSYPIQSKKNYYSPGIYLNAFTDAFEQVQIVTGSSSETITENIGSGIEYGFKFSSSFNLGKWGVIYPYFSVFRKEVEASDPYKLPGAKKTSFAISLYNVLNLPKKFSITNTYYLSNSLITSSQDVTQYGSVWIFGIHKNLFKNDAGKISLITFNPFRDNYLMYETETRSEDFYEVSGWSLLISNYWALQFSYNFQQRADKIRNARHEQNAPVGRKKRLL